MLSFVGLCVLLGLGHLLRMRVRLLRKLYLPSCVIGGLLGLAVLQIASATGGTVPEAWTAGWGKLPGLLINVVFACLFLGVKLPKFSTLWRRAGPQLAYGQVVAWGQYVVGVGLVLALLGPLFGVSAMFGGIIPVGFEGGHGTAGGMGPVFAKLGWPEGKDFGLASATAGIISAIVVGMVLVNWATRRGYTVRRQDPQDVPEDDTIGVIPVDRRPSAGKLTVSADAIESFTLHLVIVGAAILLGYFMQQGLLALGWLVQRSLLALDWGVGAGAAFCRIMDSFPLFPLCMLGGLIVQILEERFDRHRLIDLGLTRRIQNSALDFLVVAAIATINIRAMIPSLGPFFIIVAAAIAWNVFCVVVLARRMLPDAWFERSIAEMGQSMGVTATGLLLLRVVDPDYETPAADAFASKQLLHEPFMGGGLWTSAAIPLLATVGAGPVFLIATAAVAFWIVLTFAARLNRARAPA